MVAPQFLQQYQLFRVLDAFGDDIEIEGSVSCRIYGAGIQEARPIHTAVSAAKESPAPPAVWQRLHAEVPRAPCTETRGARPTPDLRRRMCAPYPRAVAAAASPAAQAAGRQHLPRRARRSLLRGPNRSGTSASRTGVGRCQS